MTLLENCLSRIFNLDLLREIMAMLSTNNSKMTLYKQYFTDINCALGEDLVQTQMILAET